MGVMLFAISKNMVDICLSILILLVVLIVFTKNKKQFFVALPIFVLIFLAAICFYYNLQYLAFVFFYISLLIPISMVIIVAPQVRRRLATNNKVLRNGVFAQASVDTKKAIVKAVFALSESQTGALITMEKNISLDQYALKAININSDVTSELLINIFTPLTPLHDGAVIIKGNKIRCAGAYYTLAQQDHLDKTTGSRHRAALGISEVSDSLTIVVSEETGNVSLTIEGVIIKISEEAKLIEYLDMFFK